MEIGRGMSRDEGLVEVREGPLDPERRLCPWGRRGAGLGLGVMGGPPRAKREEAAPAAEG